MRRCIPAAATVVLSLACGSGDPQPTAEQPDAGAAAVLTTELDQACGEAFAVLTGTRCGGIAPPGSVLDVMRARYVQSCAARLSLPGTSWTVERFATCAAAGQELPCDATQRPASCIVLPGALAAGAACQDDSQCASTHCERSFGSSDGRPPIVPTCGTCSAAVATGSACAAGAAGVCLDGAACAESRGAGVCEEVTYGAAGDPCDGEALACGQGTACDTSRGTCVALGVAGAPCASASGCILPLTCDAGRCAEPNPAGASCSALRDCAPGLVCTGGHRCATPSWREPGESCGPAAPCLTGTCPNDTGVCPRVEHDGSACVAFAAATTCESFAACTGSRCILEYSTACP